MASVFVLITFAAEKEPKPSSPRNEAECSELTSEEETIASAVSAQKEPDGPENDATTSAPTNPASGSESDSDTIQSDRTETESGREHSEDETDSSGSLKVDKEQCTDGTNLSPPTDTGSGSENTSSSRGKNPNGIELKIVRTPQGDVKVDNNTDTLIPLNDDDDGGSSNKQVTFVLGDSNEERKNTGKEVADGPQNKNTEKETVRSEEEEEHPEYDRTTSVDDYGGTVKLTAEVKHSLGM